MVEIHGVTAFVVVGLAASEGQVVIHRYHENVISPGSWIGEGS